MHSVREIWLRHVKCAAARRDLFHFTLRPTGAIFHNFRKKIISHSATRNISLKTVVICSAIFQKALASASAFSMQCAYGGDRVFFNLSFGMFFLRMLTEFDECAILYIVCNLRLLLLNNILRTN